MEEQPSDTTQVLLIGSNYKKFFPSLNTMNRTPWYKKTTIKKELALVVMSVGKNRKKRKDKKVTVEYNRSSVHLMDEDNFYSSLKYALDCLKKLELIHDDSRVFLDLKATQTKVNHFKDEKIELLIYDYQEPGADISQ